MQRTSVNRGVYLVSIGALALLSTACGSRHAFVSTARVKSAGAVQLLSPPPGSSGPGLGPAHPFFVNAQNGYVATTGGAWYVPKTGFAAPLAPAEIDATSDGGSNWRVLLREPQSAFDTVTFSGRFGYALGERVRARSTPSGGQTATSFVVATTDGGATWTRRAGIFVAKSVPLTVPGATPVALQAFGPIVSAELNGEVKRSVDGGRHWSRVAVPAGTTLVRFASPQVGYAGASAGCSGGEMLWRTADAGRSWQPVIGTCSLPFTDIEAHGSIVTTAQGTSFQQTLADRSLLHLSLDGGTTWRVVADERHWREVAYVYFSDRQHGFAVSSENDQGFEEDQLHVSSDGGRTWRTRSEPFAPVTMFGPSPTQPAFAGRNMWAGEPEDGLLWRSSDLGQTWTVSTRPQYMNVQQLAAVRGSTLVVTTAIGTLESRDGARSWRPAQHVTVREAARLSGEYAYIGHVGNDLLSSVAYLRRGASWRRIDPPTLGAGAIEFTSPRDGMVASGQGDGYGRTPVALTEDGGTRWHVVRVPRGVHRGDHVVLGPNVIVIVESPTLYVSVDEGRHWRRLIVPREIFDCGAANYSGTIWIGCTGPGSGPTRLLRSSDDGRSWTIRRGSVSFVVMPVSSTEAWAIGGDVRIAGLLLLWHTVDGGATWTPVWTAVSPRASIPQ